METLIRFRLLAVRLALLATLVATFAAAALSMPAAKGVLGGGIAGVLAFWITARHLEKLARRSANRVNSANPGLMTLRLALYCAVLVWAYTLDKTSFHGVFGAAAGLFIIRGVVVLLGITGWDLNEEDDANGSNR